MKKHKTGKGTIIQYESMHEFEDMLDASRHISGRDNESSSSDYEFTGTRSFEEAENLRKFGDRKSYEQLLKVKETTDKAFVALQGTKAKQYNDVQGFQPIVPNAIIGLPLSMVNQKRQPKKVKTIDIFVNASTVWSTDKKDIALRGSYTLSAIDALERSGYRVNLYLGKVSWADRHKVVGFFMNIKRADQPLNLMKTAYYLVNPSFLRRTGFRVCENEENIPDITSGYGSNTEHKKQREFIRENVASNQLVVIDSTIDIRHKNDEEKNVKNLHDMFAGILDRDDFVK